MHYVQQGHANIASEEEANPNDAAPWGRRHVVLHVDCDEWVVQQEAKFGGARADHVATRLWNDGDVEVAFVTLVHAANVL